MTEKVWKIEDVMEMTKNIRKGDEIEYKVEKEKEDFENDDIEYESKIGKVVSTSRRFITIDCNGNNTTINKVDFITGHATLLP